MTIKERLTKIETEIKFMHKLLYAIIIAITANAGVQII